MKSNWELTILDAEPGSPEMGGVAAGDIDGDGNIEVVIGAMDSLHWYRPATHEHGVVPNITCHVGMALEKDSLRRGLRLQTSMATVARTSSREPR